MIRGKSPDFVTRLVSSTGAPAGRAAWRERRGSCPSSGGRREAELVVLGRPGFGLSLPSCRESPSKVVRARPGPHRGAARLRCARGQAVAERATARPSERAPDRCTPGRWPTENGASYTVLQGTPWAGWERFGGKGASVTHSAQRRRTVVALCRTACGHGAQRSPAPMAARCGDPKARGPARSDRRNLPRGGCLRGTERVRPAELRACAAARASRARLARAPSRRRCARRRMAASTVARERGRRGIPPGTRAPCGAGADRGRADLATARSARPPLLTL